jgi:DNA-binding transcriptional ArsR family regulator
MSATPRRDVFQAIADPTRRQIIELIAKQSMNLNSIAENFDMSRPAISQQIKILSECGMVIIRQKGRERICEVQLDQLSEVSQWIETYRKFWETKLDNLEMYLHTLQKKKKHGKK